ncbi:MAG TPA: helix-turn-helix transcriptional regulator [Pirellulales bacterium]|nr:helix-turn-helix transcriptional regulator [Pirellulales bacterium]
MSKTARKQTIESGWEFIVLDSGRRFPARLGMARTCWVRNIAKLYDAFIRSPDECVWIVTPHWTERLLKAASAHFLRHQERARSLGDLLMLAPPRNELVPSLHSYFRRVVGEVPSFKILPTDPLAEVLASDKRGDLFIGGIVDEGSETLTLARGNFGRITVPLSIFRAAGPTKPDFQRFELDDYGYTIRFGDYEASAHSVLFGVDPDYRRRINKQRKAEERGFGPSLRRLRLLRGLSRNDIPGIASKTMARIERGETDKPHGETLSRIASVLDVSPEEIESY